MIVSIARCADSTRPSAHWQSAARSLTTAIQAPRLGPATPGLRVWYAPTWEGDRPSIAYGSLASHGVAIIEALLADPSIRIIYRPHAEPDMPPLTIAMLTSCPGPARQGRRSAPC